MVCLRVQRRAVGRPHRDLQDINDITHKNKVVIDVVCFVFGVAQPASKLMVQVQVRRK